MSRYISFITLIVVIALLIILFYKVMAGFFVPLFLAALLVVIFRPLHVWILGRCRGSQKIAALLTTGGILLTVLVPITVLFLFAAFESQEMLKSINKTTFLQKLNDTRQKLNLTMPELADELNVVRDRLDNLAEIEQLEDVAYLGMKMRVTGEYNTDISTKIGNDPLVLEKWQQYLQTFSQLKELQEIVANPLDLETDVEDGEDPPNKPLLHDFQEQLAKTSEAYQEFKVQALGGSKFWVWLREFANPTPELIEEYGGLFIGHARNLLVGLGKTTSAFLVKQIISLAIMVISLYFFLIDGPKMLDSLKSLSPIEDAHEQELIEEFGKVSRAVVVATLLAALVQAALGGIAYYLVGLENIFLLTLLTGCFALIPFLGTAAIWVPCTLWLFFVDNNPVAAGFMLLFGILISSSDNFIKPYILHGQSNLHPLFAFLSIIGGVTALGPIGILIGPMIVAFLQTLLKILQRELKKMDKAHAEQSSTASTTASATSN